MDVCKNCHEKDKNVIKCEETIENHINLSGHTDFITGRLLNKCYLCGRKAVLYLCDKYDTLDGK